MEPDQRPPEVSEGPSPASQAFGAGGQAPRWAARSVRLGVLLTSLMLAILALMDSRGVLSGAAGSATGSAAGCQGVGAPEASGLNAAGRARLRADALAVFADRTGRLYEQGVVRTANLWSDNQPVPEAPGSSVARGGYEARWWALDPEGRQDDVVVDVLRYGDPGQARRALAVAADPRCHREGSATRAASPSGARGLSWINPDGAYQHDTLLARGPYLYRVSDAPPGTGRGRAGAAQAAIERARVARATDVLACSLPLASCASGPLAGAAAAAGVPAYALSAAPRSWPSTPAQSAAYLRAVSVRPYDLPWMFQAAPASSSDASSGASGPPGCRSGATSRLRGPSATSPVLEFREHLTRQTVFSYGWMLASEAASANVLEAYQQAVSSGCLGREYERRLARSKARGRRVVLSHLVLTPLATPPPASYTGGWRYRATATRISVQALLRTRAGGTLRLRYYQETFIVAYRRALFTLAILSTGEPLSEASRRYLESALVGRAEARWGAGPL